MTTPQIDCGCGKYLQQQFAVTTGTSVTVSTHPPLMPSPFTTTAFICPHGRSYWPEPTGEQIAAWGRDGVR